MATRPSRGDPRRTGRHVGGDGCTGRLEKRQVPVPATSDTTE